MAARDWFELGVAIGTVLLATAAFCQLRSASQQTQATVNLAKAATDEIALLTAPRLIPGSSESHRDLPVENIGGSIGEHWVLPVLFGVANAGNGVAVIEDASCVPSQMGSPHAVLFPPTVRPGGDASVRVEFTSRTAGIPDGERFTLTVVYRGSDRSRFALVFAVTYLPAERRKVTIMSEEIRPDPIDT